MWQTWGLVWLCGVSGTLPKCQYTSWHFWGPDSNIVQQPFGDSGFREPKLRILPSSFRIQFQAWLLTLGVHTFSLDTSRVWMSSTTIPTNSYFVLFTGKRSLSDHPEQGQRWPVSATLKHNLIEGKVGLSDRNLCSLASSHRYMSWLLLRLLVLTVVNVNSHECTDPLIHTCTCLPPLLD